MRLQPEFLPQFAVMGSAYMKAVFGMESPRVGMLNNGTEACKGTPLQTEAYGLLAAAPGISVRDAEEIVRFFAAAQEEKEQ